MNKNEENDDNETTNEAPVGQWESEILRDILEQANANTQRFDLRPLGLIAAEEKVMKAAKMRPLSRPRPSPWAEPLTGYDRFIASQTSGKFAFRDSVLRP